VKFGSGNGGMLRALRVWMITLLPKKFHLASCLCSASSSAMPLGLEVDPDKTEIMFFHPRVTPHHSAWPATATITIGDGKTLTVTISHSIRYLGVFFTPKLDWKLHVSMMANRARSTVKALSVLGSSIRGISLMSWWKLFHALILPVLTYGCMVWFTDSQQKSLIDTVVYPRLRVVRTNWA
jgi:hypothetical protein